MKIARPGIVATHHWSKRNLRPDEIISAPFGQRRLGAEAEEAEAGGGEDDRRPCRG